MASWYCISCNRTNERVHPTFCKECHHKNLEDLMHKKVENSDKWFIHTEFEMEGRHNYTITTNPNIAGWNTDSGYEGYGLPKELAELIVYVLNFLRVSSRFENEEIGGWKLKPEFKKEEI